jgi:hypothetical protein
MRHLRFLSWSIWLSFAVASCGGGSRHESGTGGSGGSSDQGGTGGGSGTGGSSGDGGSGGSPGTGGSAGSGGTGGSGGDVGGTGGDQGGSSGGGGTGGTDGQPDAAVSADAGRATSDGGGGGGQQAILVWGHGEHGATTGPPAALDMDLSGLLTAKGLKVVMVRDAMSSAADATGKALVVISSSVDRALVTGKYKDVAVPAIVIKDGCFMPMGMGSDGVSGVGLNKITILPAAASDPLAAGLTGDVVVYTTTDRIIFSMPGPDAKKIASMTGAPGQLTIFAYDAGANLVGGAKAPAKRLGFFIHRDTDLNANGKKLFNAAIDWALH